ncbi:sensor histidine kinase [Pontibacter oryzae]|uniref:histidine kinase n=1 Tax=Pontibacter oryzae TaxID=2304593 RepID=A0A399SJ76_9BACT|nr:ATP-binding protein [Pontibacter oryzae]RIJ42533.1 tetratricopeptide repeat protein [Pontibacter oryzae]
MKHVLFTLFLLLASVKFTGFAVVSPFGNSTQSAIKGLLHPDKSAVDSLNELAFREKRHSLERAFNLLQEAAVLANDLNYVRGQAINALYEGGIYMQNGYEKRALGLYYRSLELSRSISDTFNIARANHQLANALAAGENLAKAEELYLQALEHFHYLGETEDAINIKNNLGLLKLKQKKNTDAIAYVREAQQESEDIGYTYGLKKSYFHLGLIYEKQNMLSKADAYFQRALEIDKNSNDRYGMSLAETKLAQVACSRNQYARAVAYAEAALKDAQAISASQLMVDAVDVLIKINKKKGDTQQVIYWEDVQVDQQKEMFQQEKSYALHFLDILRQKQDQQLASEKAMLRAEQLARRTNYMLLLVSVALLLLGTLALVWYRFYQKGRVYGLELELKNAVIEQNAAELDKLNRAMAEQNKYLEDANQLKSRLFSIISHDLRGPLSSVQGIINLLMAKSYSETERLRITGLMRKEMTGVMALLQNLLFWSKAQLDGEEVNLEPIALKQLIEENMQLVAGVAQQKGIKLVNDVAENAMVLADKQRLDFVLRNLLMNALKFTFPGGVVQARAQEQEQTMVLSVADNGKGMSALEQAKIFQEERYTTLGTAREKGTGLGLMFSKDFVESQSGSLNLESEEGVGTTFHIELQKAYSTQADHEKVAYAL